ncbi:MAG: PIN domain-containing protein [Luteimonas sp.]
MDKPYYLIDFENVQPRALDCLKPGTSCIKVFVGAQQTKVMLDLARALQPFGTDAEYIQITGSGPDAVDFHIAYYIGCLSAHEPSARFRIVSKDTGFDPLVRHLVAKGIDCKRVAELGPVAKPAAGAPGVDRSGVATTVTAAPASVAVKAAVAKPAKTPLVRIVVDPQPSVSPSKVQTPSSAALAKSVLALLAKSTKPGTVSGLRASIKSWLKPALDEKAIDAVLQSLKDTRRIVVSGTKVSYPPL